MNSSLRHVDLTRAFRALRCYYQYIIQGWSHIVMFSCTTGYLLLESYPWKLSCLCTLQSNESRSLLPDGEIQWCIKRCAVSTTLSVQLMVNLQVTDFYCVHDQAFNLFPFFYKLIPRFLGSVQYQITDDVKMWSQQKKCASGAAKCVSDVLTKFLCCHYLLPKKQKLSMIMPSMCLSSNRK